jgi:hypothetical protein
VAGKAIALAPNVQESVDIGILLHCIVIAAAAEQDEAAWTDWLRQRLTEVAAGRPH